MMGGDIKRLNGHVRQFGHLFILLPVLFATQLAGVSSARAINWEGHHDWLVDTPPFQDLIEGVPPPLLSPRPACADREKKHQDNPYEQTAIPGVNCMATPPQPLSDG
jgi:hypothetical protein